MAEMKLEPCPFCGGPGKMGGVRDGHKVHCITCNASAPPAYHGPKGWAETEDRAIAAWNRRTASPQAPAREGVILKGVGKTNGDGWKDTTVIGEAVFVWNSELPSPYAPGQYPRIGNEGWSASTAQYDFTPATVEEVRSLFAALTPREEAPTASLLDTLNAARAKVAENPERAAEIRGNWTNGEEAPAEGAGERDQIRRAIADGFSNGNEQYDDASETMRLCFDMAADAVLALRARTSEPEAGVRIKAADLREYFDLWKATTPAEDQTAWGGFYAGSNLPRPSHPSPATADKLRVAVALDHLCRVIRAAGVGNLMNGVQLGAVSWAIKANDALERADAALATLSPKEEGALK